MSALRPFNATGLCPKCGCLDIHTKHMERDGVRSYYECKRREALEHMHRHCRRCGYSWDEAPLDSDGGGGDDMSRREAWAWRLSVAILCAVWIGVVAVAVRSGCGWRPIPGETP